MTLQLSFSLFLMVVFNAITLLSFAVSANVPCQIPIGLFMHPCGQTRVACGRERGTYPTHAWLCLDSPEVHFSAPQWETQELSKVLNATVWGRSRFTCLHTLESL